MKYVCKERADVATTSWAAERDDENSVKHLQSSTSDLSISDGIEDWGFKPRGKRFIERANRAVSRCPAVLVSTLAPKPWPFRFHQQTSASRPQPTHSDRTHRYRVPRAAAT